jgi:glycosyltransferase involved in cell wall biosynthesis
MTPPSQPDVLAAAHAGGGGRLRVMQVILSRGFAGSERAAAEACAALSRGHEVAVVVRSDHRNAAGASVVDAIEPGITVFEVPPRWGTERRLGELVAAWRPDVIHTHLRRGTRYVARMRKDAVHVSTLHLHLNGRHYLRTDGLFCISEWQLATVPSSYRGLAFLVPNSLVPHPRLPAERVRALRAEFGAGDDVYLVGGVGRLVDRKGFDVLIRAFAEAGLPNARLLIVGDGSERGRLERMAGARVAFAGFRRDVKDFYQAFDLFVCPSSYEPFGRVIAEALDAGVPVVAADTEGPRDIARRCPIELVPPGDVDALAASLRRHAAAGRIRVATDLSEYSLERTAGRMEEAYRTVLETVRPTAAATGAVSRVLFAPVTGPGGAGELMRCLVIARELARAEPEADIRFLVARDGVFREAVEFPIIDLDDSPTRSTPQVIAAIRAFQPDVMVFDNSGRTEQLRAAVAAGTRVVFSSRAPRLRWKAFRIKWMRLLDEHWMVFPAFVTGGITWLERIKLGVFHAYRVRQFDTLFTPSEEGARRAWLAGRGLEPGAYVVFVPGGRGEASRVAEPADLFVAAARKFVAMTGQRTVVLTGRKSVPGGDRRLTLLPRIEPGEVQHLLAEALFVVSNGGTTLIHALAHRRPLVAVPLASDQDRRIRRAVRLQIAVSAARAPAAIAAAAARLLREPARREAMTQRIAELRITNGIGEAVAALRSLARRPRRR